MAKYAAILNSWLITILRSPLNYTNAFLSKYNAISVVEEPQSQTQVVALGLTPYCDQSVSTFVVSYCMIFNDIQGGRGYKQMIRPRL